MYKQNIFQNWLYIWLAMFLSKRENGIYYLWYRSGEKWIKESTGCRRKSEALKYLADWKTNRKKVAEEMTWKLFSTRFLEYSKAKHRLKTYRAYKISSDKFTEYLDNPSLTDITHKIAGQYLEHREKTSSIYMARKDLINLKSMFYYALRNEWIFFNPFVNIKIKLPEKQPKYFRREEFEKFFAEIVEPEIREIVLVAVHTGLRLNELMNLTSEQIQGDYIVLSNQNKMNKTAKVYSIPIADEIRDILSRDGRIFNLNDDFVSKRVKRYIRKAKINPTLNFHSLRHTFASWLVQDGVPLKVVSELLGHTSVKTTEIYSHLSKENLKAAINGFRLK